MAATVEDATDLIADDALAEEVRLSTHYLMYCYWSASFSEYITFGILTGRHYTCNYTSR